MKNQQNEQTFLKICIIHSLWSQKFIIQWKTRFIILTSIMFITWFSTHFEEWQWLVTSKKSEMRQKSFSRNHDNMRSYHRIWENFFCIIYILKLYRVSCRRLGIPCIFIPNDWKNFMNYVDWLFGGRIFLAWTSKYLKVELKGGVELYFIWKVLELYSQQWM